MTDISLKVGANDRNINIQCHAVNQEVADTKVESHTVSVLCKYTSCDDSHENDDDDDTDTDLQFQILQNRPRLPATAAETS